MKWGRPIECASDRAWATAEAEQQLRSASFSGSAHSSSVTASVGAPEALTRCAATVLSTPLLIATSVGPRISRELSLGAHRRAQRAGERIGGHLGGVQLGDAQPAELVGDLAGADPGDVEDRRAADEGDGRAGGGAGRPTAARGEAGVGDPRAVDRHREGHLVTAGAAARGHRVAARRHVPVTLGRGQVMLEGERVHRAP